ncbi:PCRF domain-containing protein, partial [Staphylococcus aureus]|uniref:PCRF domain-containing protein n=1 Tax=Staphylococcus aureus TaxID=1280 RepID=UPI0037D9C2FE
MLQQTYQHLNQLLTHPHLLNHSHKLPKYSKDQPHLQKTLHLYPNYKAKKQELPDIQEILSETD